MLNQIKNQGQDHKNSDKAHSALYYFDLWQPARLGIVASWKNFSFVIQINSSVPSTLDPFQI